MNLKISTVAFTLAKAAEILYCHREKLPYKKVSGAKHPDAAIASVAVCALSGPIGWGAAAVVAGTGAAAAAVGGGITAAVTAKD